MKKLILNNPKPFIWVAGALALLAILLFGSGCSIVTVNHEGFRAVLPAWPWQDSSRVMERMTVSTKTNSFTASVRGLNDSEATSTNAAALIESIARGAAQGVAAGLK